MKSAISSCGVTLKSIPGLAKLTSALSSHVNISFTSSHVKISFLRNRENLVFHRYLYNKRMYLV